MSKELFSKKQCDSKKNVDYITSGEVSVAINSSQKRVHRRDKKISEKKGERKGKEILG